MPAAHCTCREKGARWNSDEASRLEKRDSLRVRGAVPFSDFETLRSQALTRRPNAMADRTDKVPENVPGRFYVDVTCIDCDLCRETAPLNFRRDDAGRHSYVFHQPAIPPRKPPARPLSRSAPSRRSAATGELAAAKDPTDGLSRRRLADRCGTAFVPARR